MYILKSICLFVLEMALLAYPCAMLGQDEIDAEIREEMTAWHDEVRTPGLAAIRRNHNLSDDEFSSRLVKLATVTTNGQDATLRMFTVAAIGDFGTTNALEFLENEALRGGDVAGGIRGFGAIVGFNDRFFNLAEQMLADKSVANSMRRKPVYNVFESILCSDVYRGKTITPAIRGKATESLKRHALTDSRNRVRIDLILSKYGPEAQFYRHSPTRRRLAELAMADADSSDYERGYFSGVLEQMEREAATTNAVSNKRTRSNDGHKPTPNLDHKDVQSANDEEMPVANEKAQYWRIILSLLAILVAVLSVVVGVRRKRNIRKSMVSHHGDGGICSACK